MNRFERTSLPFNRIFSFLYPILTFLILLFLFMGGIRSVADTSNDKQKESLENALNRGISQCYALEGKYPPSLDYISRHYGLMYDEDKFVIDYNYYGDNLLPEFTVLWRQN